MITQKRLHEVLRYTPKTGEFLWLARLSNRTNIGDVAGCPRGIPGYRVINVDGVSYAAHRLAWLYMTGAWPNPFIDHVNGVKGDNRWCNLREATKSQNFMNTPIRADNKSGFKGVCLKKDRHGRPAGWDARIKTNGKQVCLGTFKSPIQAALAYRRAALALHGKYAIT
jgi:hypothetical protein